MGDLKVLIVSQGKWDDNQNLGNTLSNIFQGWDRECIAHICTDSGKPNTNTCTKFYSLDELSFLNSVSKKQEISFDLPVNAKSLTKNKALKNLFRFQLVYWLRDLFWLFLYWKKKDLVDFVNSYNPDIIFLTFNRNFYVNRVQRFIVGLSKSPAVMYTSDDGYTFKQFSLSPFFWIDRFIKRKSISKTVHLCSILYVISSIQKCEFSKLFGVRTKLLWKGATFDSFESNKKNHHPLQLVYSGNINLNRWKTLCDLGRTLDIINIGGDKASLLIYTSTYISRRMQKGLKGCKSIVKIDSVQSHELLKIHENADILVHVESFSLKYKLMVRMSFSTKIVDYLSRGKCIFAIGPAGVASIDYLLQNNAAIVATSECEIAEKLRKILETPKILDEYAQKAWQCGKRNHQFVKINTMLKDDFQYLVGNENENFTN